MQFYQTIFQRSWAITRKHPALWLFGLFALFWGGKGIDFELYFTNADALSSYASPFRPEFWDPERWSAVFAAVDGLPFGALLILAGLSGLVVFALIMASHIGIVDAFGFYAKQRSNSTKRYSFDRAFEQASHHLFSVSFVNLVTKGLTYTLLAVTSVPLFLNVRDFSRFLTAAVLFLVLTSLGVVISIVGKYAVNFVVLQQQGVVTALRSGMRLFIDNVGVSIEQAVIMFFAYIAVNIAAIMSSVVLTMPLFIIGYAIGVYVGEPIGLYIYAYQALAAGLVLLTLTSSIFSAWHLGSWTLLFQELTKGKKRSKVHRVWKGE